MHMFSKPTLDLAVAYLRHHYKNKVFSSMGDAAAYYARRKQIAEMLEASTKKHGEKVCGCLIAEAHKILEAEGGQPIYSKNAVDAAATFISINRDRDRMNREGLYAVWLIAAMDAASELGQVLAEEGAEPSPYLIELGRRELAKRDATYAISEFFEGLGFKVVVM